MVWKDRLYCKSCEQMEEVPDSAIELVVTSPPYWNAIDYEQQVEDPTAWYRTRKGGPYEECLDWLQRCFGEVQRVLKALPETVSLYGGGKPAPQYVYFPPSHAKALRPDVLVVWGMRGAGKTFWWAALQDPFIRKLIARVDRFAQIEESTEISIGFGEKPQIARYPDKDTLSQLLNAGREPRRIWRAVVAYNLLVGKLPPIQDWAGRIDWVENHPEEIARWLEEKDQSLQERNVWAIILFDALDRAADRWKEMYALIRGLLQMALELRPTRRIRVKCFLRPDQMEASQVATFPDASKVLASAIPLTWPRIDLYGLLWQYLANTQGGGEAFREVAERELRIRWEQIPHNGRVIWQWPRPFRQDEEKHRKLFRLIAGEWMGRDRKWGFPYSWLPGHLADAHGQTSPRSFLAALRKAAEDTRERYPEHPYALHYESIKRGVQQASQIRVRELAEDYPWIDTLMRPLDGLLVPCEFEAIKNRWEQEGVLEKLQQQPPTEAKLLPVHLNEGFAGLRKDPEELGVFSQMEDGRVNVPDVFRVGYWLGRKGGVKPL